MTDNTTTGTPDNSKDREEVAAKTGVPEHLLRGDTREELEHHASQLADAGITTDNAKSAAQIVDGILGRTPTAPEPKDGEELSPAQIVTKATAR